MLTLWKPNNDLFRLGRELDDMFNTNRRSPRTDFIAPAVDIQESEDGYVLTADLPGVAEEAISLEVHEGVLTVTATREEKSDAESNGYTLRERRTGEIKRSFRLGDTVDSEKIGATYKNGVLTVSLPKAEVAKPRQIEVSVN